MEVFNGISRDKLEDILGGISDIKIALIGDLCLDVYWRADMTKSELSRETPHFPLPVVEEWMSLGAGGNVAANIAALRPGNVRLLGVIGRDWRGDAVIAKLRESGINTDDIVISDRLITNAYCKPVRKGISPLEYEDPRLDFANYENLPRVDEAGLLRMLDRCKDNTDVLCVSDQFVFGCITDAVRRKIISLAADGLKVVVDSRDRIHLFTGAILKPNAIEGLKAINGKVEAGKAAFKDYRGAAEILAARNHVSVCMTLGPEGCIYVDSQSLVHIPSYEVAVPMDPCGAGDTFLSAFACALAAGAKSHEAASFANMAADVTITKIGTTGTASPEEIMKRHEQITRIKETV